MEMYITCFQLLASLLYMSIMSRKSYYNFSQTVSKKIGLSGIVKRYGFQTVYNFHKVFAASKTAYIDYWDEEDKLKERYDEKAQSQERERVYKRLQNYQRKNTDRHIK